MNIDLDATIISYSIDHRYRGQGHGKNILMLIEKEVLLNRNIKYLKGKVKFDNIASQVLFEKLSYTKYTKNEYVEFVKPC